MYAQLLSNVQGKTLLRLGYDRSVTTERCYLVDPHSIESNSGLVRNRVIDGDRLHKAYSMINLTGSRPENCEKAWRKVRGPRTHREPSMRNPFFLGCSLHNTASRTPVIYTYADRMWIPFCPSQPRKVSDVNNRGCLGTSSFRLARRGTIIRLVPSSLRWCLPSPPR